MSSSIQSFSPVSGGLSQADRAAPRVQPVAETASPKVQVQEVAKVNFAKKAEVGQDMQQLAHAIEDSVQRLNDMMKDSGRNLNIGVDRVLGGPVVTVRNAESGEVIRQIPNEVVVKMAHSIEAFKGWLHDGNA
jgi:flagellar protein FlaG